VLYVNNTVSTDLALLPKMAVYMQMQKLKQVINIYIDNKSPSTKNDVGILVS